MIKFITIYSFLLFVLIFLPSILFAQQDTTKVKPVLIELKDGSKITGVILEETEETLVVKTEKDLEIKFSKDKIKSRRILNNKTKDQPNETSDFNEHRLLISSTGKNLKKGTVYFAVYELFLPVVGVGITDFFSVSGGVSLIPGAKNQLVYLSPKFTFINRKNFYGSIGAVFIGAFGESFGTILYGSASYGNEDYSATFGYGTSIFETEIFYSSIITLGGEAKISRRTKIISDNFYFVFADEFIYMLGFRVFGENLAGEFGFFYPWSSNHSSHGFPFIPWLSISYKF